MNLFGQTKSNISRTASVLGAVGLSAIALAIVAKPADAATIKAESDYLQTQGGTAFNFGTINNINFGLVEFMGVPIGAGGADTIVERKSEVVLNNPGDSGRTEIEVTGLSLKSKTTVNGYNISVGLTPGQKSTGEMTFTAGSSDSEGTFSSSFNVFFDALFTPVSGGQSFTVSGSDAFAATGVKWSQPPSGSLIIIGPFNEQALLASHTVAPVPEPLTIIGSGIAAGFGIFFKKQADKKRKKQTVS
ncbi:MAG TPA: hypothetical protein DCY88_17510 [Cyanobacteria bacterium UBA11372]|nr:hypothetical protein [Cyanobacteria bacterium UBA11372]